jgi:hypothetical protein
MCRSSVGGCENSHGRDHLIVISVVDLVSIREGLSSPESGHLTLKHPSLSGLSEDITAAIALLECAEEKLFNLVPREEFASPT